MNWLQTLDAPAEWILRCLLLSLAISALTLGCSYFWRRRSPYLRNLFLKSTLSVLAVLPFISLSAIYLGIGWKLPATIASSPPASEEMLEPLPASKVGAQEITVNWVPAQTSDLPSRPVVSLNGVLYAFGFIWIMGAFVSLARQWHGIQWLQALLHQTRRPDPSEQTRFLSIIPAANSSTEFRLATIDIVPFTTGIWRQKVVLPAGLLNSTSDDELELVLQHEHVHWQQRDQWWLLLQRAILCLYWWNPAIYKLDALLSLTQEEICDHQVARDASPERVRRYQQLLLRIAQSCQRPPQHVCALAVSSGFRNLKKRLLSLDPDSAKSWRTPDRRDTALAILVFCSTAIALSFQANAQDESKPEAEESESPTKVDVTLAPSQETNRQIYITSKFIESEEKIHTLRNLKVIPLGLKEEPVEQGQGYHVLTDPQFQVFLRALSQQKGVDLLSAPSLMARDGQQAKVQVIREFELAPKPDQEEAEILNLGITLELTATTQGDKIHLQGSAIVREADDNAVVEGNARRIQQPLQGAVSFNTVETYFSTSLEDGKTLLLPCRTSDKQKGSLLIAITARPMEPPSASGAAKSKKIPHNGTVTLERFRVTMDEGAVARHGLEWLLGAPDDENPGAPANPIAGVFTNPQMEALRRALETKTDISIQAPVTVSIPEKQYTEFQSDHVSLAVNPSIGEDGYTIDLNFMTSATTSAGSQPSGVRTYSQTNAVTLWDEQWFSLALPAENASKKKELLFLKVSIDPAKSQVVP